MLFSKQKDRVDGNSATDGAADSELHGACGLGANGATSERQAVTCERSHISP